MQPRQYTVDGMWCLEMVDSAVTNDKDPKTGTAERHLLGCHNIFTLASSLNPNLEIRLVYSAGDKADLKTEHKNVYNEIHIIAH